MISVRPIRVTGDLLRDLGGGASTPRTVEFLRSGQLAKHLHLLLFLIREAPPDRRAAAKRALELIATAQTADPDGVDDLLSAPFVGAWLSSAVRRRGSDPGYLDRLPALAVAAGLRAEIAGEIAVPTPRGVLELPGAGRVDGLAGSRTLVAFDRGRLDPARGRMEPLRTVPLGDGYALEVEDVDPYRGCYHKPAAGRLTEPDVARWAAILTEAWRLLAERAPGYAAELAAGLRALVPLVIEPGDPDVSATSRIAFGAVGLSLPRRPDHLAASLVHEFQHSKLSALLDMIALHGNDPERRYFAPWRRDARPLGGLLQGAYAFLAVGDLWRRLGVERETLDASDRTFPDLCAQLAEVLETLHAAEGLNEVGRRMVAELRHRFDALLGGAVPAEAVTGAATRLERHRQLWREFNHID